MHKYRVIGNLQLTPTTLLLTLQKDKSSKPFSFEPGQYAAISFKHHGRPTAARCFSIVSSPTDSNMLQFSMRTNGKYTTALKDLKEGDAVQVRGPFGGFVLKGGRDTNTVLLAGGIGITPFMSMIRYATATNFSGSITLIFSSKNQDDVPFADELIAIAKSNPRFKPVFVFSDGPTDKFSQQSVANGRITNEVIANAIDGAYDGKTFFICGPQPFMRGMTELLENKGVPHSRIMTEAFSQGPNHQTGTIRSWPFNIYALSAVGLALGSFVVMVTDLLKTLPPSSIQTSTTVKQQSLSNSRQTSLDALVNAMPEITNSNPASDAASKAVAQATTTSPASTPQTSTTTTTPTSSAPTTTTTTTPTPAPTPTPVPAPAPKPKCTTTQSGVTTCV